MGGDRKMVEDWVFLKVTVWSVKVMMVESTEMRFLERGSRWFNLRVIGWHLCSHPSGGW